MHITKLYVNGFKNLKNIDIFPHPFLNIFCGDNAQGKTNLIEAIWLCSGVKSFRSTKEKGMININGEIMNIEVAFKNKTREQIIRYNMAKPYIKEKSCSLNGVKLKAPSKLFGSLECVIFTPDDLELSKGSPEKRRQFLDLSVSQIKHSYNSVIEKYEKLVEQRNMLLKNISYGKSQKEELEVWDIQLAQMGAYVSFLRYNYTKKLNIFTSSLYNEISREKEQLEIKYSSTVFQNLEGRADYKNDLAQEYLKVLDNNRSDDIRSGFTQKGVHRDDINCYINGLYARDFASQGQHRSIALILKLAQAYILAEETDDPPCILLDDVLSELDPSRQDFVISKIDKMQVFITCCDDSIPFADKDKRGKIYHISKGCIVNSE